MSSKQTNKISERLDNRTKTIQTNARKRINNTKQRISKSAKQVPKELSKLDKLAQVMVDYKYIPLIGFTFLYVASPIDFLPEFWLGGIGYLEDVLVIMASVAFVIYTKKRGVRLRDNKSRYSEDKTDEELYAFIVRNDGKPDSSSDVREQDTAPVDNINLVGSLVGDLPMDDMSIPAGDEPTDTEDTQPAENTEPVQPEPSRRDTSANQQNLSSEPRSCFDYSSVNICGVFETRERFSTPCQPDTQRVDTSSVIW